MRKLAVVVAILFAGAAPVLGQVSDDAIRDMMIQSSIGSYSGNCPCPYNVKRNGASCGGTSAWSRPGGASPLCYRSDISDGMVDAYRARYGL